MDGSRMAAGWPKTWAVGRTGQGRLDDRGGAAYVGLALRGGEIRGRGPSRLAAGLIGIAQAGGELRAPSPTY